MGSLGLEGWSKSDSPMLQRIAVHNAMIKEAERRLWTSAPLWRHIMFRFGARAQLWRWFYSQRYRLHTFYPER